jgi:hypothetical protein
MVKLCNTTINERNAKEEKSVEDKEFKTKSS